MNIKTLKQKPLGALAIVFLIMLPMFLAVGVANAAGTAVATVSAVQSGTTNVSTWSLGPSPNPMSTTFKVDIYVSGIQNLWAINVLVNWNASVVHLTGVQVPSADLLDPAGTSGVTWLGKTSNLWDNVNGLISGGLVDVRGTADPTPSTAGVLCTLTFTVVGYGNTGITLGSGSSIKDPASGVSTPTLNQATVTVIAPACAISLYQTGTTNPHIVIPSSSNPIGMTFNVTMHIDNAIGVWGWNANVQWNPAILNLVKITNGGFLNASGSDIFVPGFIDNYAGTVQSGISDVLLSYTSVSGNGDLAILTFNVTSYGTSTPSPIVLVKGTPQTLVGPNPPHVALPEPTLNSADYVWIPGTPTNPQAVITATMGSSGILNTFYPTENIQLSGANSVNGINMIPPSQNCPITNYAWSITLPNGTVLSFPAALTVQVNPGGVTGTMTATLTVTAPSPTNTPAPGYTGTGTMTQTFYIVQPWVGGVLDIYTNKGGQGIYNASNTYAPQELVTIYAYLSYNGAPVVNKDVAFQIVNAQGQTIDMVVARTQWNGMCQVAYRLPWSDGTNPEYAFGNWTIKSTVSLSQVTLNDTCMFYFGYTITTTSAVITDGKASVNGPQFNRYGSVPVTVNATFKNVNWNAQWVMYTATIYDNASVPVAFASGWVQVPAATPAQIVQGQNVYLQTLGTNGTISVTMNLYLPTFAFVGPATLYVNAFTQDTFNNGVPYCPQVQQPLIILAKDP